MSEEKEAKEIAQKILRERRKTARQVPKMNIEKPDPNIYLKEVTFTYISIEDDPTGEKYVQAQDVDFFITDNPNLGICPNCQSDRFVYLVTQISAVMRVCLRCQSVQGPISKDFGTAHKPYRMEPSEAIRILKSRNANRRTLSRFERLAIKQPYRLPRKRPTKKR